MNECLLLACGRLYTTSMYNIDVPYFYSLANEILHCAHKYLPYLPTFPYLMVYSGIVKKEKKKKKE